MTALLLILVALTLAVLALLLYPLLGREAAVAPRAAYDLAVYRSQLAELDSELASGVLTAEEGDAARLEIQRRMLAAQDAEVGGAKQARAGVRARRLAIGAVALVVPLGAGGVYAALGSPQLPGEPYAWRVKHDAQFATISDAAQLAKMLEKAPSAAGYRRLSNLYFAARDYDKAARADHKAIDLGADDGVTWSEFGEAIVMAEGGMVTPEALVAFTNALQRDPSVPRTRFYIGLADAQIGKLKEAVSVWRDLERVTPPNASWATMLKQHIASVAKQGGFAVESVPPAPPSLTALQQSVASIRTMANRPNAMPKAPQEMAAAASNSLAAQDPKVRAMVDRLAQKMGKNPGDADGWQRLAHSYNVMGEPDKARAAIEHAVKLKPNDPTVLLTLAETQKLAAPKVEVPDDMVVTLRKVLAVDPANVEALYYVGIAEAKNGKLGEARKLWTMALSVVQAGDPLAADIKKRLDGLKQAR